MLINFSVENFRSFGEEQTLNLVASRGQTGHEEHCVQISGTDHQVLKTGIIYGANASGKSNLVRAIDFAQDLILSGASLMKRIALNQFRFTKSKDLKPSSFEFRFMVDNQIFVYGFDVTPDEVKTEWLSATNSRGKEIDVFNRHGENISFGDMKSFPHADRTSEAALKAIQLLGTRPNQLLLNKIVDLAPDRRGELLDRAVRWFSQCLVIVKPSSSFAPMIDHLTEDQSFRLFAQEFLSNVSTGIDSLTIEENEISADKLPKHIIESLQTLDDSESTTIFVSPGMNLYLAPDNPSKVIRKNLTANHCITDDTFTLPFDQESDGTQRLLNLLPALYHLKNKNKVYVIDELDRSLHPLLSHALLEFFVDSCPGSCQQLIFTTHETHLLDLNLLRRDEIWFTEKDDQQQTQLYSLTDMKVRKDLRIEKSYLQGRFGGIPFIGGLEKLEDLIEPTIGQ